MKIVTAAERRGNLQRHSKAECSGSLLERVHGNVPHGLLRSVRSEDAQRQAGAQGKDVFHIVFLPAHGIQALPGRLAGLLLCQGTGVMDMYPLESLRGEIRIRIVLPEGEHSGGIFRVQREKHQRVPQPHDFRCIY